MSYTKGVSTADNSVTITGLSTDYGNTGYTYDPANPGAGAGTLGFYRMDGINVIYPTVSAVNQPFAGISSASVTGTASATVTLSIDLSVTSLSAGVVSLFFAGFAVNGFTAVNSTGSHTFGTGANAVTAVETTLVTNGYGLHYTLTGAASAVADLLATAALVNTHPDTDGTGTYTGSFFSTYDGEFAVNLKLAAGDVAAANPSGATYTETFTAACFATGTSILTPAGTRSVETLAIGDFVSTAAGQAKPIKWIGRRTYSAAQVAANRHLAPVIIKAGALAANTPVRDLTVSAMHSMLIDEVFVPAAALVNGSSVVRADIDGALTYLHIELETHDAILAEGAPTETFVDDNSRLLFDNADEFFTLYGATNGGNGFSARRLEEGFQLEAIRRRIAARTGVVATAQPEGALAGHVERLDNGLLEGWVMDTANPTIPVELEILVDNEIVARVLANRYRVDLDRAGIAQGSCGFTVMMPASAVHMGQVQVQRASDTTKLAVPQMAEAAI